MAGASGKFVTETAALGFPSGNVSATLWAEMKQISTATRIHAIRFRMFLSSGRHRTKARTNFVRALC